MYFPALFLLPEQASEILFFLIFNFLAASDWEEYFPIISFVIESIAITDTFGSDLIDFTYSSSSFDGILFPYLNIYLIPLTRTNELIPEQQHVILLRLIFNSFAAIVILSKWFTKVPDILYMLTELS